MTIAELRGLMMKVCDRMESDGLRVDERFRAVYDDGTVADVCAALARFAVLYGLVPEAALAGVDAAEDEQNRELKEMRKRLAAGPEWTIELALEDVGAGTEGQAAAGPSGLNGPRAP